MNTRSLVWFGLFVGSTIGSFLPSLWGAGVFSVSSVIFSALGGIAGVWAGFKLSQ